MQHLLLILTVLCIGWTIPAYGTEPLFPRAKGSGAGEEPDGDDPHVVPGSATPSDPELPGGTASGGTVGSNANTKGLGSYTDNEQAPFSGKNSNLYFFDQPHRLNLRQKPEKTRE